MRDSLAYQPNQEDELLFKERQDALRCALAQLPKRTRDLLELSIDGLSDNDTSNLIGIRAGAVRKQRYDLIKKLKRFLGGKNTHNYQKPEQIKVD